MANSYTYLIGWRSHDLWYYGRRTANTVSPSDDLWKRYFTSSKFVAEKRTELGEPDVVRIHKEFESVGACRVFEEKFIDRVKAVKSERWLNRGNAGRDFDTTGRHLTDSHREAISKHFKGKKLSIDRNPKQGNIGEWSRSHKQSVESIEKRASQLRGRTLGPERVLQISACTKGIPKSETHRQKLRKPKSPEHRAKIAECNRLKKPTYKNCTHCGMKTTLINIKRWHNDNCKLRIQNVST